MALLSRRWSLLDVDDVEALAWRVLATSGQVTGLQPHQRDDLCTHVITTIWEASLRFDPNRNVSFSTYAYVIGQRSIVSWFRSTSNGFGRTRWKFGDGRIHERARPEFVSLDTTNIDPVGALEPGSDQDDAEDRLATESGLYSTRSQPPASYRMVGREVAMHESKLNYKKKLIRVLLLAADDMNQAKAAARALHLEAHNVHLMRALETAMAVCYARAFTTSTLMTLPDEYVPTTAPHAKLHKWFRDRRDEAYAHTDKKSGRDASAKLIEVDGRFEPAEWRVEWLPFPREWIDPALDLYTRQRDRFRTDAARIQAEIEGFGQRSGSDD